MLGNKKCISTFYVCKQIFTFYLYHFVIFSCANESNQGSSHVCYEADRYGILIGAGGKSWYVSNSGLVCTDGDTPEDFCFEFLEHGRIAIRSKNGKYLRGDQGGNLKGDGENADSSSLWEYWHHVDT